MSFLDKLIDPKKLELAGWIMIVTLYVACLVEYYTNFQTVRYVKTVFIYLLLDYCWFTFKREYLGDRL